MVQRKILSSSTTFYSVGLFVVWNTTGPAGLCTVCWDYLGVSTWISSLHSPLWNIFTDKFTFRPALTVTFSQCWQHLHSGWPSWWTLTPEGAAQPDDPPVGVCVEIHSLKSVKSFRFLPFAETPSAIDCVCVCVSLQTALRRVSVSGLHCSPRFDQPGRKSVLSQNALQTAATTPCSVMLLQVTVGVSEWTVAGRYREPPQGDQ